MSDVNGTVVGLQGRDVDSAAPSDGDVLTWDNGASKWTPQAPPAPLEPWVGTSDTQRKIIQRIPFVVRTTGPGWVQTAVQYTLPTDSALVMWVHAASRAIVNKGVGCQIHQLCVANNAGTLTTPGGSGTGGSSSGSFPGNLWVQLTTSGTTATLEVAHPTVGAGVVLDCQGFVDLMLL